MQALILISFFLTFGFTSGQIKVDSALLFKTDWQQINDSANGLGHCIDCKSAKLTIYKNKTWSANDIIVDSWKIKKNEIILHNMLLHGTSFNCKIIELTEKLLVINYLDEQQILRTITLKAIQ